jgi:hypothetical protein
MKKWKVIFISIAIVVGIGGAFASNSRSICSYYVQFRYTGGTWVQVDGEQGLDWDCVGGVGICTYYKPNLSSPYLPCHFGIYTPINFNAKKSSQ